MTTLLDKQRSATRNDQGSAEAALDQVLSRIAALAPMIARRSLPTLSKVGDCRQSLCPLSGRRGFTACSCLGGSAALNWIR